MHRDWYADLTGTASRYAALWDAFDNGPDEVFYTPALAVKYRELSEKFRVNFARIPIGAILNRLAITAVTSDDDATQEFIDQLREDNQLALEEDVWHEAAMVYGDAYAMVWPTDTPGTTPSGYDVVYEPPGETRVVYPPRGRTPLGAVKRWVEKGRIGKEADERVNVYTADEVTKYVRHTAADGTVGPWLPYLDVYATALPGQLVYYTPNGEPVPPGHPRAAEAPVAAEGGEAVPVWPLPNIYRQVPVTHFRVGGVRYGRSDLTDALGPAAILHKIVTTHPHVIEFSGAPSRWALTDGSLLDGPTNIFDGDEEDTDGGRPAHRNRPGELTELPDRIKSVGEFTPADPDAFLKPLDAYLDVMASMTDTPVHKFKGMQGAPSGDALDAADGPNIAKAGTRRDHFAAAWQRTYRLAAHMAAVDAAVEDARATATPGPNGELIDGVPADDPWTDYWLTDGTVLPDPQPIAISWAPLGTVGGQDRAKEVQLWDAAGAASVATRVRRLHPDWTADEVATEVAAIEGESAIIDAGAF